MVLNCLIIDDEPLGRKGLEEYIAEVDFLRHDGSFDQPMKALPRLSEGGVHLVFLDIQMPRLTGLDFLRSLPEAPPVIFTTAYPQHALEGFELNALDYLVKPISFERFLKAVMKARAHYELIQKGGEETFFFVKADNRLVRIFYRDVLFVEALQNYVAIHTTTKKYITYLTFKAIEEYLPAGQFIRTHKSYIVAAARIDNIEGNEIRIGPHHIPIARNSREEVLERLLKGRYLKR